MTRTAFALILCGICLILPAWADETAPETDEGRYMFSKVADGFLRLDLRTGQVSLCSQRNVGWSCQAVPEDRAVLENEIARLRSENVALKKELIAHNLSLPSGVAAEPPAAGSDAPKAGEKFGDKAGDKTGDDIDRMVEAAGRLWHRFVDAIARAQRQVLNNKS